MFVFQITYATPKREDENVIKFLKPVRISAEKAQTRAWENAFTVVDSAAKAFDRFILG